MARHVADDILEQCAMRRLPEAEAGPLEEHLLICPQCQDRLEAEIEFVAAMKGATAMLRKSLKEL
jgi:hypothetical protein